MIAQYKNGTTYTAHNDHLGSPRLFTDVTAYYVTGRLASVTLPTGGKNKKSLPERGGFTGGTSCIRRDSEAEPSACVGTRSAAGLPGPGACLLQLAVRFGRLGGALEMEHAHSAPSFLHREIRRHLEERRGRLGALNIGQLVNGLAKPRVTSPGHDHQLQVGRVPHFGNNGDGLFIPNAANGNGPRGPRAFGRNALDHLRAERFRFNHVRLTAPFEMYPCPVSFAGPFLHSRRGGHLASGLVFHIEHEALARHPVVNDNEMRRISRRCQRAKGRQGHFPAETSLGVAE